jgi:pimeloyl-ACP methyl ester carboxylesterase
MTSESSDMHNAGESGADESGAGETDAKNIEIRIPGFTIAAKAWGPEDGIPVLSAHGWLDNAGSFDRLAPMLDGMRIVAFDFPGHGRSPHRPRGTAYHFIDTVPLFFDIADALGWPKFSLLCHSMGACAAALVAGTLPERIERMVLLDGFGPKSAPPEQAPEQLAKELHERNILAGKTSRAFASPDEAVATIAQVHGIAPESAALLMKRGLEKVGPDEDGRFVWNFTYDLRLRSTTRLYLSEEQVLAFFARITCPTLLIRPRQGWPFDKAIVEGRIDAIDDVRFIEVEGNHHVHLDHPERVAQHVQDFLHTP